MLIYVLLTISTILMSLMVNNRCEKLSYGYSKQQVLNGLCLLSVFLLLFAISALRLNVGNDYAKYVEIFHLNACKLGTDTIVPTEPGFNLICILIYLISGREENFLLMFAFFAFLTILFFLKGMYEQSESFTISFIIFMLLGYYFHTFSTVRYYFALSIAFISIPYVLKKQWGKFILLILLGALFHKSVLLVIVFYYLSQRKWKSYQIIIVLLLCGSFFVFKDFYINLFYKFYPTYEGTGIINGGTSYIAILRCVLVLIMSLLMYKKHIKEDRTLRFYFYSNIGAMLVYLCMSFLPDVSRAGYYLSITHILFVPSLINRIEKPKLKIAFKIGLVVMCIVYFGVFLLKEAPADGLRILPYETWLYHDMVSILSDVS